MLEPKICFVHDYLVQYGGAEKTLEAMLDVFPGAPVYTGVYNKKYLPDKLKNAKVFTPTFANTFPLYMLSKQLTFLMPVIFERFNLDEFDIVISDGSTWAKGVITKPHQLHISYIHTPPRFLYGYSVESLERYKWFYKPFVAYLEHYLRIWDFSAAQRPNYILTNSEETKKRIKKFYRRDAKVIYPPVETKNALEKPQLNNIQSPFYLMVGRMSAYKNFDLIIQVFNLLGYRLLIIGTGKEEKKLRKMAKDNIEFLGQLSDIKKHQFLEECLGLIFPVVEEDFGIVVVEALAHGKPVFAHKSGGALETIREGVDGMFFDSLEIEKVVGDVKSFDFAVRRGGFKPQEIKEHASRFDIDNFKLDFKNFVLDKWKEHNA